MYREEDVKDLASFLLVKEFIGFGDFVLIYLSCDGDNSVVITYYVDTASGVKHYTANRFSMESITSRESLQHIIEGSSVPIDTFLLNYNRGTNKVDEFLINCNPPE